MNRKITLTKIRKTKVVDLLWLGLLLVAALAMKAHAQTILIDDFDDDNADGWSIIDASVGESWGPGTFDASSGAYHLEGDGLAQNGSNSLLATIWDESSDPIFSDGFVRVKVRSEALGGQAGIAMRISGSLETGFSNYTFSGTNAWSGIRGNAAFSIGKNVNGRTIMSRRLPNDFRFGVGEWWNIEAGAVGDRLSIKVWRVGDPEPESPQLTLTDSTLRTGKFAVWSNINNVSPFPGPDRVDATFDDIYFRFPEHDEVFSVSPYNIYLWASPMPVPQQEGPYFVAGSPEKPDMRSDVTKADDWPDLHLTGKVTDFDGKSIPGLKLDFWQTDDQGNYDNSGGYDLRGHVFTDEEGNYELWTVIPAAYETVRTRHLHLKIGGVNLGFSSPVFTTQLYFPTPYDNDIDADGTPDKVVQGGFETDFDAIPLEEDYITLADLLTIGAEFSDLAGNILTLNNDPAIDGYFDATLSIRMSDVFQAPERTPDRILIDDFNDGNTDGWTIFDWTIEQSWGPGTFDTSSRVFNLEGAGLVPDIWGGDSSVLGAHWEPASDPIFIDGFVRAKLSVHELGSAAGLFLRGSNQSNGPESDNAYGFFGNTAMNGFFFGRYVENVPAFEVRLPSNLTFGVDEQWYIEAGAVGDQLSMKVWRVGDTEPESPQWTRTDRTHRSGAFGVVAFVSASWTQPARTSASVDDIYFTFAEHGDVYTVSPYNIYLWESPMPVPQVEEPYFVAGSPNKTDMRGDITKAEGWPDIHLTGKVTDLDGKPIPGLRLDFWQVDDKGSYDNSGGYDLRGHFFTDKEGNYELWTIMPAAYNRFRTRKLQVKLGGLNLGFSSPVYTTQLYFPNPYDNDIDADGTPDKVIQDGVEMDSDAIGLEEDSIALVGLVAVDAEPSDLASNTMTLNNDPAVDGYFDATLDIVMPQAFQANQ
jgi:protocatechuate 3,4-dioxygenase beta subunit